MMSTMYSKNNTSLRDFFNELFDERLGSGDEIGDDDMSTGSNDSVSVSSDSVSMTSDDVTLHKEGIPKTRSSNDINNKNTTTKNGDEYFDHLDSDTSHNRRRRFRRHSHSRRKQRTRLSVTPDNPRRLSKPKGGLSISSYHNSSSSFGKPKRKKDGLSVSAHSLGSRTGISKESVNNWRSTQQKRRSAMARLQPISLRDSRWSTNENKEIPNNSRRRAKSYDFGEDNDSLINKNSYRGRRHKRMFPSQMSNSNKTLQRSNKSGNANRGFTLANSCAEAIDKAVEVVTKDLSDSSDSEGEEFYDDESSISSFTNSLATSKASLSYSFNSKASSMVSSLGFGEPGITGASLDFGSRHKVKAKALPSSSLLPTSRMAPCRTKSGGDIPRLPKRTRDDSSYESSETTFESLKGLSDHTFQKTKLKRSQSDDASVLSNMSSAKNQVESIKRSDVFGRWAATVSTKAKDDSSSSNSDYRIPAPPRRFPSVSSRDSTSSTRHSFSDSMSFSKSSSSSARQSLSDSMSSQLSSPYRASPSKTKMLYHSKTLSIPESASPYASSPSRSNLATSPQTPSPSKSSPSKRRILKPLQASSPSKSSPSNTGLSRSCHSRQSNSKSVPSQVLSPSKSSPLKSSISRSIPSKASSPSRSSPSNRGLSRSCHSRSVPSLITSPSKASPLKSSFSRPSPSKSSRLEELRQNKRNLEEERLQSSPLRSAPTLTSSPSKSSPLRPNHSRRHSLESNSMHGSVLRSNNSRRHSLESKSLHGSLSRSNNSRRNILESNSSNEPVPSKPSSKSSLSRSNHSRRQSLESNSSHGSGPSKPSSKSSLSRSSHSRRQSLESHSSHGSGPSKPSSKSSLSRSSHSRRQSLESNSSHGSGPSKPSSKSSLSRSNHSRRRSLETVSSNGSGPSKPPSLESLSSQSTKQSIISMRSPPRQGKSKRMVVKRSTGRYSNHSNDSTDFSDSEGEFESENSFERCDDDCMTSPTMATTGSSNKTFSTESTPSSYAGERYDIMFPNKNLSTPSARPTVLMPRSLRKLPHHSFHGSPHVSTKTVKRRSPQGKMLKSSSARNIKASYF